MRIYPLVIFLLFILFGYAAIINVPEDQPTIQTGINASANGDTVLVQPGTYLENINLCGKNILLTSLYSSTLDTTYISTTVIDGNSTGTVVTIDSGEGPDAILSGLTITNGYTEEDGAGIRIDGSEPTLDFLIVSNNTSLWSGAGIHCHESFISLTDSRISGNSAEGNGGGINLFESTLNLDNSIFTENQAEGYGGAAISTFQSYLYINNCSFRNNYADGGGGAILSDTQYIVNIKDSEICFNTSTYRGGGFMTYNCQAFLDGVTIHHNTADLGGAVYNFYSNVVILNCTIADNQAMQQGSAIGMEGGVGISLLNCIIYDNPGTSWSVEDGIYQAAYCDIENYGQYDFIEPLENVIDEDPLFMDHPTSEYYLRHNSPCHDTGIDSYVFYLNNYEVQLNIDEFSGEMPDMGAVEFYEVDFVNDDHIVQVTNELICYPNPFNPETNILFNLDKSQNIDLSIYNLKGQIIDILYSGFMPAGEHNFSWDGNNSKLNKVSSGIYLAVLKTQNQRSAAKLILLK